MMYVNCEYLREFAAVARAGSFTKAALDSSISQSCLSRHMKSLESSIGLRLLIRTSEGVRLTEAGCHVLNYAGDIADIAEDVLHYAKNCQSEKRFSVHGMTVFPTIIQALSLAAKQHSAYIKVCDAGGFGQHDICPLLDAESGIYITMDTDYRIDFLPPEYEVRTLLISPLVAIMEHTALLAKEKSISLKQLEGQLLFHAQSDFHGEIINWSNTKELLRLNGIGFRSKTATLENESDLLGDFKTGILLFPEDYKGVAILMKAGKACIPVEGANKSIVAISKKEDSVSSAVLSSAIEMLGGKN